MEKTSEFSKNTNIGEDIFEFVDGNMYETDPLEYYFQTFLKISEIAEKEALLVGNILLNKLLPETARLTKDMDMNVKSTEKYAKIKPYLTALGEKLILQNIIASYEVLEIEEFRCGGIKCKSLSGHETIAIDIALCNNQMDRQKVYSIDGVEFNGNSIEGIVADKCLASLSRKRFRRAKDFYDLYIIEDAKLIIDYKKVIKIMLNSVTVEELEKLFSNYPFSEEILKQMEHAWDKLNIGFFKDDILSKWGEKPEWNLVYTKVSRIYINLINNRGI